MKRGLVYLVAICSFVVTQFNCAQAGQADDPVRLKSGLIKGLHMDGVRIYKGIPYAAPPVGDLRWRPPQPAASWTGVREATDWSDRCPQPVSSPFCFSPR